MKILKKAVQADHIFVPLVKHAVSRTRNAVRSKWFPAVCQKPVERPVSLSWKRYANLLETLNRDNPASDQGA
ncbi:hypothetical protein ACQ3G6_14460 [Allorhizobium undicola]|uniref:hypothetical protein n=1 Tax=Allorhizobium undicola TaxID=78527 RepID=UPI000A8A7608|nr:hypothetical protein [Allorhizobium undicola]